MPGIKELKNRIKSVKSTRKITRAMQMVSAAKMRKAQNAVLQSRTYASLAWEMIQKVSKEGVFDHPLINPKENKGPEKVGILLLSTNRGLVGSLNSNLLSLVRNYMAGDTGEILGELVTYGRKGQILAAKLKKNVVADFPKQDKVVLIEEIYPLAQFLSERFASGEYKKIVIVYNHFVSVLNQKPTVKQLLPFSEQAKKELGWEQEEVTELIDQVKEELEEKGLWEEEPNTLQQAADKFTELGWGAETTIETSLKKAAKKADSILVEKFETYSDITFEPTPQIVIEHLIPRIIESQIYQTILEAEASEQSARMVMMKNATEAAGDLIDDYTLTYNQLRQGKITTELAEITAGKIALE